MRYLTQHSPHKSPSFKFKSTFTSEAPGVPPVTNTLCDTVKECVCVHDVRERNKIIQAEPREHEVYPTTFLRIQGEGVLKTSSRAWALCLNKSRWYSRQIRLLTERSPYQAPRLRQDLHLRFKLQSETEAIKERHPFLFCWRLQSYLKGMCWYADSFILTHFVFSPQNIMWLDWLHSNDPDIYFYA